MDPWTEGDSYEYYMGRWSELMGHAFLTWLDAAAAPRWLDVGCGTGALTETIMTVRRPDQLAGVDASPGFVAAARRRLGKGPDLRVADAQSLPFPTDEFDGQPEPLTTLFTESELEAVQITALEIPTTFTSFDDYWQPFLGGQGPAPSYVSSLDEKHRHRLATTLERALPTTQGGVIELTARSWAVKALVAT